MTSLPRVPRPQPTRKRLMAAAVALSAGAAIAAAPELTPAGAPARDQVFDQIVATELALGSDAWRAQKLAQSSRHHAMVTIPGAGHALEAFLVYPDTKDRVPLVMMIPEDQGLNNWARNMADEIAAMGYVVVVPDLLSGLGPDGGGRGSFPDIRSVIKAHSALTSNEAAMTAQLNSWADYAKKLAQVNGKFAVVGFAWGGGRAFWLATQRKDLNAAFIFYDVAPPAEALAGVTAIVHGFYADIDPRVTKSLAGTKTAMAAAGKQYDAVVYPGSEHMFVRLGDEPGNSNPANIEARALAMARLQQLLKSM